MCVFVCVWLRLSLRRSNQITIVLARDASNKFLIILSRFCWKFGIRIVRPSAPSIIIISVPVDLSIGGSLGMVANMNVEKFIEDIYERPVIWNRSYSGNKPYLDETWTEMAQLHQLGSKFLSLSQSFRVYCTVKRFLFHLSTTKHTKHSLPECTQSGRHM